MANRARGEVTVRIGETEACLCLTLGALAVLGALLLGGGRADLAAQLQHLPVSPQQAARWITDAFEAALDDD